MSLASLIATGSKVWLDGVDPDEIEKNRARGITGATSNPAIISKIVEGGHFDARIRQLIEQGNTDQQIAWELDDELVTAAQQVFLPVWERTKGNDGYVSFELDPFIDVDAIGLPHAERVRRYIELGRKWSASRINRMIKVPATPAGIDALETLAAEGITINVTLMFTQQQYQRARDAIWRGASRRNSDLRYFKSVYSIFVSRVDVFAENHFSDLSTAAKGMVGIAIAKRVWQENHVLRGKNLRLQQEIIFASTSVKRTGDPPDKYVRAFAGGDILTNPPATNEAVYNSPVMYDRQIDDMPSPTIIDEIDCKVDMNQLEQGLLEEGIIKFAKPQKALLALIAQERASRYPDRTDGTGIRRHSRSDNADATQRITSGRSSIHADQEG